MKMVSAVAALSLALVLRTAGWGGPRDASTTDVYKIAPESRAFFVVHAHNFAVPETVLGRQGTVQGEIRWLKGAGPTLSGHVSIDADTLKTGNGARDKKMLEILGAKAYPFIDFTITGVEPFSVADLDGAGVTVNAHGALQVGGVEVPLSFGVFARREGGRRLRLHGLA